MTEFSLSGCELIDEHLLNLGEDSLQFFKSAPLLKSLNLSYNSLSLHSSHWLAKGILRLTEQVKKKSTHNKLFLGKLDLYGNNFGNKGLKLISTALAVCENLKALNIGGCKIDDAGATEIVKILLGKLLTSLLLYLTMYRYKV